MKTILVLGVGLGTSAIVRHLMRTKVLPSNDYKLIVVSPTEHFHWTIAMPRAIIPSQYGDDKVIYPLASSFKEYPADKFNWIVGSATNLDPANDKVVVALTGGGSTRSLSYDYLIIGTGASSVDNLPWKALETTEKTIEAIHTIRDDITRAKSVVVAGGGLTGVEIAGELGFEYGQTGEKDVYFIHNDSLPLAPPAVDHVRKQVVSELERLRVKIIPSTKVTKVSRVGKETVLDLQSTDDSGATRTLTAQAYLPALGVRPNSAFAPRSMLDEQGYIKQDTFLRAEGLRNVFVIGDVGSLQANKAMYAEAQAAHLIKTLPEWLDKGDVGELPEYKPDPRPLFMATIGRSRGTGQFGRFKVPSLLVWYMKGRHLGTDVASEIALGKRHMMSTFEK